MLPHDQDPRCADLNADLERWADRLAEIGRSAELSRMQSQLQTADPVLSRSHFSPGHFTASAFVLSPDRCQLLLILHKKLRLWLQPGGHIDPADVSWSAAARREVEEETGLTDLSVEGELIDIDIHEIPAISREPAHLHFDVRMLFIAPTIEVQAGDDVARAQWFSVRDLVSGGGILVDGVGTDESVLRVARRALLLEQASR